MVRAHLIGEVPITKLDFDPHEPRSDRVRPSASERSATDETPIERDSAVDEASDESFPASDPPSFTASRV